MKPILKYILAPALLALAAFVLPTTSGAAFAAGDTPANTPRDAHQKFNCGALATPIREKCEIRVIVGLDAPQPVAELTAQAADRAKEKRAAKESPRAGGHTPWVAW